MLKVRYLITGATGVIGSALVRTIVSRGCHVTCPVRDLEKAKKLFSCLSQDNVSLIETELLSFLQNISGNFDYIIHCASPTASKFFVENPVETITFGIDTTTALLSYCRREKIKSFVYLSSLEVYGTITDDSKKISEEIQGYVNPLDVRSSYNMVKRMCETLCHAYFREYDIPVKIVRLTQVIPSTVPTSDMRIFAQFARKAAYGENIELHTDGISARPYLHIEDAVSAILTVLYQGENGEAYNACNEETYISAKSLAKFVQTNFNPSGKVITNLKSDMGYAPPTKIKLDSSKIESLGWKASHSLFNMFDELINNLKH